MELPDAESRAEDKPQSDVCSLLCLKGQLKQQLMEYGTAVDAMIGDDLENITEESSLERATTEMEKDMNDTITSFKNKTLALQRFQHMSVMKTKLTQSDNCSRKIKETLKEIAILSNKVIKLHQELCEKEQKLIAIQRRRSSLKKAGDQALLQSETITKNRKVESAIPESTSINQMHHELQKEKEIATIVQGILQNIVLASKVNWAEDPSLKAIVLQLEKNVFM